MDSAIADVSSRSAVTRAGESAAGWLLGPVRLAGRPVSGLWRAAWSVLIAALTAGALVFDHAHRDAFPLAALLLSASATAPLLVVWRWPLVAISTVAAADGVFVVYARLPWPPTAVVTWLLALALSPLLLPRVQAIAVLVASEAAVLAAVFVPLSVNSRPWDAPITEALAALVVWGAGETVRARAEAATHRTQAAAQVRDLQEREALARGRAAIARELHDVVAHHVSLIAVRAASAPYQIPDLSPAAKGALGEIAEQARTALDELRTVLGVLRSPEGLASHAPQPRLTDLPELLERMRASGMTVVVETDGAPRALSDPVELCCYRVIQETLTNAARHAPGEAVQLTVSYRPSDVALAIVNRIGSGPAQNDPGRSGLGLIGMRERLIALGGTFTAERDTDRFRVEAAIPTAPARHE